MREYSTPLTIEVPRTGNLTDDVVANAREAGSEVVFNQRSGGDWQDVTAARFLGEVSAVAKGLVAAGIEPGDRVALISRTRYEWTLVDYAIWFAGAVTVPLYETSSADQIGWILRDSGARAVVAEGKGHLARIAEVRGDLEQLNHVWAFEDNAIDVLTRLGADISDDELEKRRTSATPLDLATLIYTSGTTGRPKGCMLTHGNFMFELGVAVDELEELFAEDGSTLLFLPLAHVLARIVQVGCVRSRTRLAHSADITRLSPTWSPTGRRSSSPCRASSRRCSTPRPSAPPPTGGAGCSTGPRRPPSRGRGGSTRAGRPSRSGPGTRRSRDSSTAGCATSLGGACRYAVSGRRPARATGSATSTAASD